MRQQLTYNETTLPTLKQAKQDLYASYGAMLLGYIVEVVKDRSIAERYFADIFTRLDADTLKDILSARDGSAYCRLQQYTRNKLVAFINTVDDCADIPHMAVVKGNRIIELMNAEQQVVFCGVHYHGKTTAKLAADLDKTEDEIRRILKQSFTIIRNNRK